VLSGGDLEASDGKHQSSPSSNKMGRKSRDVLKKQNERGSASELAPIGGQGLALAEKRARHRAKKKKKSETSDGGKTETAVDRTPVVGDATVSKAIGKQDISRTRSVP